MRHFVIVIALLLAASAIGNCNSAKLVASIKNPAYSGQRFKKVLVIGMSDDPAIRSDFEDALANKLTRDGVEAIPGHSILLRPDSANMDLDYLKAQIREHHIEAVLITRLLKVDKSITYIPGHSYAVPYPYYNSFYGYYPMAYRQVYFARLSARGQDSPDRDQRLRHRDARGRASLDRPQRHLQSQLGKEVDQQHREGGDQGLGKRKEFSDRRRSARYLLTARIFISKS